jgi:hypothetical protein
MAAAAKGWIFAAEVAPAEVSEVERVFATLLVVSAILVVVLLLVVSDGGGEGCVERDGRGGKEQGKYRFQ